MHRSLDGAEGVQGGMINTALAGGGGAQSRADTAVFQFCKCDLISSSVKCNEETTPQVQLF